MLLKIRYKKTLTYEAFVEVPSGFGQAEILEQAADEADVVDAWKAVEESDSPIEIVAEYGRLPTVRGKDGQTETE